MSLRRCDLRGDGVSFLILTLATSPPSSDEDTTMGSSISVFTGVEVVVEVVTVTEGTGVSTGVSTDWVVVGATKMGRDGPETVPCQ